MSNNIKNTFSLWFSYSTSRIQPQKYICKRKTEEMYNFIKYVINFINKRLQIQMSMIGAG